MIGQIELTDTETALYAQVSEAERLLLVDHDYNRTCQAGQASRELFHSLMKRKAIPEQRLRYFADPAYNASDTRASKRERFLRNARTEDAMYEHPHFWKYLIYFINGPELPHHVVDQFDAIAKDEMRNYDALSSLSLARQAVIFLATAVPTRMSSSSWPLTAIVPYRKLPGFGERSCRFADHVISRYGSLAPDGRLPPCSGDVTSGKPVITSLAGFEISVGLEQQEPVITSMAGFELAEPVVTEVAALAGVLRPQPPGVRSAIPADLR
ncbi:MAG TPA: hypothetical protein VK638_36480 [Edaphobacter sp.]|nr:hypothetical protein [Edaphobacter sp.]